MAVEALRRRGIPGSIAQSWKIGYVAQPLEGHEQASGMLALPYLTKTGPSAIRFRRIAGEGNKYYQESGSFSPLFNTKDLHRNEPYIAICEGEFDAIVMSGLVGVPAVALAGTGQWNRHGKIYARLFQDYERVFVVMDPDEEGQKAARAITKAVSEPTNIVLPADVNDTYIEYGATFIRKALGFDGEDSAKLGEVSGVR